MEVLASGVGLAGNYLCGFLSSKVIVIIKFQENKDALKKEKEQLIGLKRSIAEELEKADGEGKTPTIGVTDWLKQVQNIETRASTAELAAETNRGHLHGCFLNCRLRYGLSRKMAQIVEEVKEITSAGRSMQGRASEMPRPAPFEHVPGPAIAGQRAAAETLRRILDLLKDASISRIGIWGMGGVGKTTVMKNLNNNLSCLPLAPTFSIVIWITVSKELDLKRIQSQVAERLNMELRSGESIDRRAIRLFQRLKKEKSILLLLDDVWEEINLDKVGIPHGESDMSCKIIVTTRSLEVCRVMKTDSDVKVDVLNDEQGWWLFRQNAGDVVGMEGVRPLARSLAKECRGLPLAIITVARAMRGKMRMELWKDALMELRRSSPYIKGIEREVFLPLKWSFDSLQGNNIRPCFLYCSLFPEDFSIEVSELVQYWRAEGFIDEKQNQEDAYNRGIALIENMKDSCMLEAGEQEETVKMHDVIRDVSIWIGSSLESEDKNFVQSGMGLTDMPEMVLGTSYQRISLMYNKITTLPETLLHCSEVYTLLLQCNPLEEIPHGFLLGCQALRVLNLSGTNIAHLPPSLTELKDLQALILRNCMLLEDLPPLGNLKELRFFDLYGARIRELPRGMEELSNLRQLNLARTHHLQHIRANIMSKLSNLEELDMAFSCYNWDVIDDTEEDRASVKELVALRSLHSIYIRIDSLKFLSCDLFWINGLKRYNIFIGPRSYDTNYLPTEHDERRVVIGSIKINGVFKGLLSNASALVLDNCTCSSEISELLPVRRDYGSLKSFTIVGCHGFRHVGGGNVNHSKIPDLEELYLHRLRTLSRILSRETQLGQSHWSLRILHVTECPLLEHLMTIDLVAHLVNLEEIKISNCARIEDVIVEWRSSDHVLLPRLCNLELQNLRSLRSVCLQPLEWPSLTQLVVQNCPHLQKLPLEDHHMRTVKLRGNASWVHLLPTRVKDGWDIMKLPRNAKVVVTPTRQF